MEWAAKWAQSAELTALMRLRAVRRVRAKEPHRQRVVPATDRSSGRAARANARAQSAGLRGGDCGRGCPVEPGQPIAATADVRSSGLP